MQEQKRGNEGGVCRSKNEEMRVVYAAAEMGGNERTDEYEDKSYLLAEENVDKMINPGGPSCPIWVMVRILLDKCPNIRRNLPTFIIRELYFCSTPLLQIIDDILFLKINSINSLVNCALGVVRIAGCHGCF